MAERRCVRQPGVVVEPELVVDLESRTLERGARIQAATDLVAIDLGPERHRAARVLAQRSRDGRRLTAERELAVGNVHDGVVVGEDEHDVGRVGTDLPADAAAGQGDESGIAPAAVVEPHAQHAPAPPCTHDETAADNIRHDGDAACALDQLDRNRVAAGGGHGGDQFLRALQLRFGFRSGLN